jgi:hypothetical protein
MEKNIEIELDLLPNGEIRFSRERKEECREFLLEILESIVDKDSEEVKRIKEFLDGADDVELLLGERVLCG